MNGMSNFREERRKIVCKYLDKFPNASNHQLARMIFKDNPGLFSNQDSARSIIRIYKGSYGSLAKENMKFTKYYKNEI
jgi:hypothetical protein